MRFFSFFIFAALCFCSEFLTPNTASAQDSDLRFQVVDAKGVVTVYRDENNETIRLRKGQMTDDGDRIITPKDGEAVLRLKGRAYFHLAHGTRIRILRARMGDNKQPIVRLNLVYGRLLCQMDRPDAISYVVTADSVTCRAHSTLCEVSRKKEEVQVTAFEGNMVANAHGHVEMAKANQVIAFNRGQFRYRHYLQIEEESRLEEWKDHLGEIRQKRAVKGR
ncbi:MAG TPA: FecR domain-containing protein [bacterium]|nr:FecR domain-containing protein [bacterium]